MKNVNATWISAAESIRDLFSDIDVNSAESRYYDALNAIAVAVAEYRYSHHLTQTDLAKHLSITQAMVSKYESGDYNISLKAAFDLFDKIGMVFRCAIEQPTVDTPIQTEYSNGVTINESAAQDPDGIWDAA